MNAPESVVKSKKDKEKKKKKKRDKSEKRELKVKDFADPQDQEGSDEEDVDNAIKQQRNKLGGDDVDASLAYGISQKGRKPDQFSKTGQGFNPGNRLESNGAAKNNLLEDT